MLMFPKYISLTIRPRTVPRITSVTPSLTMSCRMCLSPDWDHTLSTAQRADLFDWVSHNCDGEDGGSSAPTSKHIQSITIANFGRVSASTEAIAPPAGFACARGQMEVT